MTALTILLAVLWMALGLVAHAVPTIAGTLIGAGVIHALLFWGGDRVDAVRTATASERSEAENRALSLMYDPVSEGVRDAHLLAA